MSRGSGYGPSLSNRALIVKDLCPYPKHASSLSHPEFNPTLVLSFWIFVCYFFFQFKQAGVIEMEASLKACRILISQRVSVPKYIRSINWYGLIKYTFSVLTKKHRTLFCLLIKGNKSMGSKWRLYVSRHGTADSAHIFTHHFNSKISLIHIGFVLICRTVHTWWMT